MEDDAFIIKTKRLPSDRNFMPTLSNGHLGFTVYGDAIFMNGLYNGQAGDSRRARIPNWLNISLGGLTLLDASYELRIQDGYFRSMQVNDGSDLSVEQRSYAHRYYTRTLIYELCVQRKNATEPLNFILDVEPGANSDAIDFIPHGAAGRALKGITRSVEHEKFQKEKRTIFILFSENLKERKLLKMAAGEHELYYRYVLSIDECEDVARKDLQDAMNSNKLLELHTNEWRKFWHEFSITVEGNIDLARTINAALFYLSNSLPSPNSHQRNLHYYGLSPTGLGRGNLDADYEGHSFWDTEIWMLPVVTQLSPNWSKLLFQYRLEHLAGAKFNAQLTGYRGARFPWESAYTGTEVTNPCFPEVALQEIHISADIGVALQQFFATTNDREWLCNNAWPLLYEIATFLISRVEKNEATQAYHIKDVMGPDEDHSNVNDSVYTNVACKIALQFASYTQQQCSPQRVAEAAIWQDVATKLVVLYDSKRDYHPQYLGYQIQTPIKQADVLLLGFPLQFPMNLSTRRNDLHTYAPITRPSGPAMTWSMYAINSLDIDDIQMADDYFERSYQDYVSPEFKVWSEVKMGYTGSANFLTGIGGFIQAIIAGYGGIRFYRDNDVSVMEIRQSYVMPKTHQFTINGLKFANATFRLQVNRRNKNMKCLSLGNQALQLESIGIRLRLYEGYNVDLSETAYIRTI